MKVRTLIVLCFSLLAACTQKQPEAPKQRAELRKLTGNTAELLPSEGQLPYCLVYTFSEKGVVRQLTMNRQNESVTCEASKPIGNVAYKFPVEEGTVRVFVLFSDSRLNASSIAQQIYAQDLRNKQFTAMDLRLPGRVDTQIIAFSPAVEPPTLEGSVVSKPGEAAAGPGAGANSPEPTDGGTR